MSKEVSRHSPFPPETIVYSTLSGAGRKQSHDDVEFLEIHCRHH
jgi:hypothetical protein